MERGKRNGGRYKGWREGGQMEGGRGTEGGMASSLFVASCCYRVGLSSCPQSMSSLSCHHPILLCVIVARALDEGVVWSSCGLVWSSGGLVWSLSGLAVVSSSGGGCVAWWWCSGCVVIVWAGSGVHQVNDD